jgi:hypothetical protein
MKKIEMEKTKKVLSPPVPNPDDPRIKNILDKLEDEYCVNCIIDKDVIEEKIVELNFNYEKIVEWVEDNI